MAFKTERGRIVFDGDAFIKTKPAAYESFMRTALQVCLSSVSMLFI